MPSSVLRGGGTSPPPHQPSPSSPQEDVANERSKSPQRATEQPTATKAATTHTTVGDMEDTANPNRGVHKWVDKPKLSNDEIQQRKVAHQQAVAAFIADGMTPAEAKKAVQQKERTARRNGTTLEELAQAPVAVAAPKPVLLSSAFMEAVNAVPRDRVNVQRRPVAEGNYFTFNAIAILGKDDSDPLLALESCTAEDLSNQLRCPSQPTFGEHFHHSAFGPVKCTKTSAYSLCALMWVGAVALLCVAVATALRTHI